MDSDFCDGVDDTYKRKVYTVYINADATSVSAKREYTTYDNFPTTLAALGVQIEGDRLGLGTNLFSSIQTLVERYGYETEQKELQKKSDLIDKLAEIDENSEALLLKEGKIPSGELWIVEYDYHTVFLPVSVSNITGEDGITSILVAVWHEEDQSNLQFMHMQ